MNINRYICIHGHFYQPPRENPWLEEIEIEDSAYPFHDWNERITSECYAPNASSRILGQSREIKDIVNNYSRISFNFGPTLLSWIEYHSPELYADILQADRESQKRFSGHGCAIAQIYNHIIMPLATTRDKHTEVIWGIRDFISRFNRRPEGMWLAETAVDYETLDILAQHGILFTILSPDQAKRIRNHPGGEWTEVRGGAFDIGTPYICRLSTGRSISIFFYDTTISNELAFGNLLENGDFFAQRMNSTFPSTDSSPRILTIASDGETYGHHHRFADMALAYAINTIESGRQATMTVFGEFLEKFPPVHEIEICENTSWSCSHGIERWKSDCGCRTYHACLISDPNSCISPLEDHGSECSIQDWNQKWRAPLREAMHWLNIRLSAIFEEYAGQLFDDPWQARNEYIDVLLDRSDHNIDWFFSKNIIRDLTPAEIISGLSLLEIQRNVLLMNTSCGWFFDELSGIETVQVMMYACRAMQLAREVTGNDIEPEFIKKLGKAQSNIRAEGTGADIYHRYVQTAVVDISRVAFHYAITSLIEKYPEEARISTYTVTCKTYKQGEAGVLKLVTGHALFRSELTREESAQTFAAVHIGDHNFMGGVGPYNSEEAFRTIEDDLWNSFTRSDVPGMILGLNRHFESHSYSLWHLFPDGRRKVLYEILKTTLTDIEAEYRQIHRRYFSLIRAMKEMHIRPPEALEYPVQYILNHDIRQILEADDLNLEHLKTSVHELIHGQYKPDILTLQFIAGQSISWQLQKIAMDPEDINQIMALNAVFSLIKLLSLSPDLRDSQNQYCRISSAMSNEMQEMADNGDEEAKRWIVAFKTLGVNLEVIRATTV